MRPESRRCHFLPRAPSLPGRFEHFLEIVGQLRAVDVEGRKGGLGPRVFDQRAQQVLERHHVVAALGGEAERPADGLEGVGGEGNGRGTHRRVSSGSGSMVTRSGNSCCSASRSVAAIFDSATSRV